MAASPPVASPHRAQTQELVIRAVRSHREVSQAEIARSTGLAPATVSNIVKSLVATGTLAMTAGSGRRGATVYFPRSAGLVAGIDFGHSHVRVTVADLSGTIVQTGRSALHNDAACDEGLHLAHGMLDDLVDPLGSPIRSIGLAVPAPVGRDGRVDAGSILPGWVGVDVALAARAEFDVPVLADNDANLGALAESRHGGDPGGVLLYLKLSTGIGAGVTIDGLVLRGIGGNAGEIGHVSFDDEGALCRCGSRGCLEAIAGGEALLHQYAPIADGLTLSEFMDRVVAGEPAALRLIEDAGRHLGAAVACAANLLAPDRIVIGGSLARAPEPILAGIREGLHRHALEAIARDVVVDVTRLSSDPTTIGAIWLALDSLDLSV